MREGSWLRYVVGVVVALALVFTSALPASAGVLPANYFALWPPHFCARSAGAGTEVGSNIFYIAAGTASLRAGSDGRCDDPSPAVAGTFAAMPRLQVWFGAWVVCVPGAHRANTTGEWAVLSEAVPYGCGAGSSHRVHAGSRITYGGTNYYDDRYTGV